MKKSKYKVWGFVVFLLCLIGFTIYADKKSQDKSIGVGMLHRKEFKDLHKTVTTLDSIDNIAILPEEKYIVINGVVINLTKRTFGEEPVLGFYHSYYMAGDSIPFRNIDSLLLSKKIRMDSVLLSSIIHNMKELNLADIYIENDAVNYRWDVSAMYGEEGIIYSEKELSLTKYYIFEKIGDNFYHFAVD